jgi:hypothetical protein
MYPSPDNKLVKTLGSGGCTFFVAFLLPLPQRREVPLLSCDQGSVLLPFFRGHGVGLEMRKERG